MADRMYAAIDLKSFYASVECRERGLDPLNTNLVVADESRTEKTICLAVTPSLKSYGIPGRARLFEVIQKVREVNYLRLNNYRRQTRKYKFEFEKKSCLDSELKADPSLELDYLIAPPRMALYMKYSTDIYNIYLKYFSHEDIVVYSIDEVFIDLTPYLDTYKKTPRELVMTVIKDVLDNTGITATAGIGTNLYLAKIAMDIEAKHIPADENGVRIAELDEMSYRRKLWSHRPLTDFWRVGAGTARKLEERYIYTMGDICRISANETGSGYDEELFYRLFGKNAELLINHAWGYEPTTIADIKVYKPQTNSISTGQVLQEPYDYDKTKLVVREMTDLLTLDLVRKRLVTSQIIITIGYDIENLKNVEIRENYKGDVTVDRYGRRIPKHSHGTINLPKYTSSTKLIVNAAMELFDRIINRDLLVRRINVVAGKVIPEGEAAAENVPEQLDFFTDYAAADREREKAEKDEQREKNMQKAILSLKDKYGKNAVLRGMNLQEGATAKSRNAQIGGHKA